MNSALNEVIAITDRQFDAVVIGAGVLGCFAARSLSRYRLNIALLEAREDVCTGISRANTAIIYAGYDNKPGSLKSRLCQQGNEAFGRLCAELGVRFNRCGSLMVCFGAEGHRMLQKKYQQGLAAGLAGLRIIEREEILRLEPGIHPAVYRALYSPQVGTVNPWELGIAAAENAAANGAELFLHTPVTGLDREADGYLVSAGEKRFRCRAVINCGGLQADEIHGRLAPPAVRIQPTAADYIVLDTTAGGAFRHVIFHEPEDHTKGLTAVPTVDGNILLGPSERPAESKEDQGTSAEGLAFVRRLALEVLPSLPLSSTIRSFSAVRPNPYRTAADGSILANQKVHDFPIVQPEDLPGYYALIGVKTPGLTCADSLGRYIAQQAAAYLGAPGKNDFSPYRQAPVRFADLSTAEKIRLSRDEPAYGRIVCRCRQVTEAEIVTAVRHGATTVDGVKRRTGACTGRCQAGFCGPLIPEIIARELGRPLDSIEKDGKGSWLSK